jgi:hypothetical protein
MRVVSAAVLITAFTIGTVFAQDPPAGSSRPDPAPVPVTPANPPDQVQPQGQTGPTNTTTGGAPPSSPQGDTPAGMQSHPQGAPQEAIDPKKPER